jgi:hypothetical protein
MENRPADTEVGFLCFKPTLVRAFAQGQRRSDAIDTLLLGDYLPVLLAHAGWWMQSADLAAGMSKDLREQLGALRATLAEVLALVPDAWSETYLHSRNTTSISVAQTLLARYIRFRDQAFRILVAALPNVDPKTLAHLA